VGHAAWIQVTQREEEARSSGEKAVGGTSWLQGPEQTKTESKNKDQRKKKMKRIEGTEGI